MLPMSLFADRRFSTGAVTLMLSFFCAFGVFFLSTLYMQYVLGYSTLATGFATLPWAAAVIVAAPRSAALGERFGVGRVITVGFVMVAASFALFTQLQTDSSYLLLGIGFALQGLGMGATFAPATGSIMSAVPLDKAGVGSAVNDTTRELGAALGIAVLGTLLGSAYRSSLDLSSAGLNASARTQAEESIGGAVRVAKTLPDGGHGLLVQAQSAFVDAFRVTNTLSIAVTLGAAVLVFFSLRRRGDEEELATDGGLELDLREVDADLAPAEA
jgi:MFS family permease